MARLAFARAASSARDGGLLFLFILRRVQRKTFRLSEQYMLKGNSNYMVLPNK